MKLTGFFLLILTILAPACGLRQKEEQLNKKEAALNQKEQELLLKEKTLEIKEQELLVREQKIDSTAQTDTTMLYNPAIIGIWDVKMTCTQTTCAGSAVGDTRTEQWNVSYESNSVIVKAMADDKLIRTYIGAPNQNTIELKDQQTTDSSSTKMTVRLRLINATTMDGEREIIRENNCKVVYSLQLNK
jgi:hypothetical protein